MQWVSNYSIWVYILILLISAGIAYWTYWLQPRKVYQPGQRILLTILRFFEFAILGFLLFSPLLLIQEQRVERPRVVIAMDHSRSVGKSLSAERLQQVYAQVLEGISEVDADIEVDTLSFGDEVVKKFQGPLRESYTDISVLSDYLSDKYYESTLRQILLITDGYANRGSSPFGADYHLDVPVSVAAVGDTQSIADFAVEVVQTPSSVLRPNDVVVDVQVSCKNSVSKAAQLQITFDGRVIQTERIDFQYADDLTARQFAISAPSSGLHSICARITSAEKEYHLANNQKCKQVSVTDEKVNIALCYESPHPDVAAIARALEGQKNVILHQYPRVPASYSEDIIIAHNIKTPAAIDQIRASRKSYWLISGLYANNSLWAQDDILKSRPTRNSENTPMLNPNFSYFDKSFVDVNLLASMPPLVSGTSSIYFSGTAQALFESADGSPMFGYHTGPISIAITQGEGLWRWRIQNHKSKQNTQMFDALIQQTVLFLRPSARKNSFDLQLSKSSVPIGEPLSWSAQYYNQNLELDNSPQVNVSIRGAGIQRDLQMNKTKDAYILMVDRLPPGSYTYTATLSSKGTRKSRSGRFEVQNVDIEAAIPYANMPLLREITQPSGGQILGLDQIRDWFAQLSAQDYPDTIVQEESWKDAIDLRWVAFLFLGLLIVEWVLRKIWGAI